MTRSRSLPLAAAAVAALCAFVPPVAGQEAPSDSVPVFHVPPIVVTVSRVETPFDEAASSIAVVTREEIERGQLRTVLEALRTVPGVALVRTGGPGGATSVFLRGASSDHALVLLDGIELNDPSGPTGGYDLATLGTAAVERIEILKGPQSTIHGSSALGGVVNIVTRRGEGAPRVEVLAEGGSYGSAAGSVVFLGAAEGWSWAATAERRITDGFSAAPEDLGNDEADGSRTTGLDVRLDRRAGAFRIGLTGHLDDSSTDIDASGPQGDDPNRRLEDREVALALDVALAGEDRAWRPTISLSRVGHDRASLDDPDPARPLASERGAFEGSAWKLAWLNDIDLGAAARLVAGAETERERAATRFESDGEFGPFESEFAERTARTTGAFAELRAEPLERLAVAVGARVDDHDRFGAATTVRLASGLRFPASGTRVRGTWGTGFKAPTLLQLYDPEFGAPGLDPERSRGWDVGIDQTLAADRVRLSATGFSTRYEELIVFAFPDGYRNENEATTRGVETSVSALIHPELRITGSYTHTRAELETGPDAGLPLIRRPRHQGSLDATWVSGGAEVMVGMRWTGEREDLDFEAFPAERVTLDGYALLRVAVAWGVTDEIRLFGRIENLLDAEYEEVLDFGTAGRSFFVGVKYRP